MVYHFKPKHLELMAQIETTMKMYFIGYGKTIRSYYEKSTIDIFIGLVL
jgi:hypothetical protein